MQRAIILTGMDSRFRGKGESASTGKLQLASTQPNFWAMPALLYNAGRAINPYHSLVFKTMRVVNSSTTSSNYKNE